MTRNPKLYLSLANSTKARSALCVCIYNKNRRRDVCIRQGELEVCGGGEGSGVYICPSDSKIQAHNRLFILTGRQSAN